MRRILEQNDTDLEEMEPEASSAKFYFFDVGVANALMKTGQIQPGSELYGSALERRRAQEKGQKSAVAREIQLTRANHDTESSVRPPVLPFLLYDL